MKALLYKDLKLAMHPACYIFMAFGAMLLIPSYPYYVAFFYATLGIFFIFLQGRENRDLFFSLLLPVRKRDVVRARCLLVFLLELVQILLALPFAILRGKWDLVNGAGIEANPALFAIVFLMFGFFNLVFLPSFYKSGYKVGKSYLLASCIMGFFVVLMEILINIIPAWKLKLDTMDPAMMGSQLLFLGIGIIAFFLMSLIACRLSEENFEEVDIG